MHRALVGEDVRRERHGQLGVEQLQTLFLGRQAQDLVLQPLVLLLQGVERLEHLHDCNGGEEGSAWAGLLRLDAALRHLSNKHDWRQSIVNRRLQIKR